MKKIASILTKTLISLMTLLACVALFKTSANASEWDQEEREAIEDTLKASEHAWRIELDDNVLSGCKVYVSSTSYFPGKETIAERLQRTDEIF